MRNECPVVSFCIPVYNNAEAAEKIAEGLLASDDERFEVIMCDDASGDDTEQRLSGIQDERFRYIRNEHNLGAHKNWLKTLELGRGKWLYLAMGRDRLYGENIGKLIEILEYAANNNVTCLEDGYSKKQRIKTYSGIKAMIHFISLQHPTGTIFIRDAFNAITDREYYFSHSDMYPENYIRYYLLLKGKGALIMSGVYDYPNPIIDKAKIKSTVENSGNIFNMFFAPARRIKQYIELIDIIDNDTSGNFTKHERNKYFREKFSDILLSVTKAWKAVCSNTTGMAHYGHSVRTVTKDEQYRNIVKAFNDTAEHLRENGKYTFLRMIAMIYISAKRFMRVFFSS